MQRKNIEQMSQREQRKVISSWKKCSKTYREKKKMIANADIDIETPPQSPTQAEVHQGVPQPTTSRLSSGSKIRRQNREKNRELGD